MPMRPIKPGATENCSDNKDNNCNGLVDAQDPAAAGCLVCTDGDGDGFAIEDGACGQVDCNDKLAAVHPNAADIPNNGIDEGCNISCPDADGDGYQDAASGGNDCNDTVATINPGTAEVCGNAVDENCNGAGDDTCLTCPDGSLLVITNMKYDRDRRSLVIKGRATVGTTISIINSDTGETLTDGIRVSKGKWTAKISQVTRTLKNISAVSSNGCSISRTIVKGNSHNNDDEEDDDRGGNDRKRNRSDD